MPFIAYGTWLILLYRYMQIRPRLRILSLVIASLSIVHFLPIHHWQSPYWSILDFSFCMQSGLLHLGWRPHPKNLRNILKSNKNLFERLYHVPKKKWDKWGVTMAMQAPKQASPVWSCWYIGWVCKAAYQHHTLIFPCPSSLQRMLCIQRGSKKCTRFRNHQESNET